MTNPRDKVPTGTIFDQLEPGAHDWSVGVRVRSPEIATPPISDVAAASIAISLKRIADALALEDQAGDEQDADAATSGKAERFTADDADAKLRSWRQRTGPSWHRPYEGWHGADLGTPIEVHSKYLWGDGLKRMPLGDAMEWSTAISGHPQAMKASILRWRFLLP